MLDSLLNFLATCSRTRDMPGVIFTPTPRCRQMSKKPLPGEGLIHSTVTLKFDLLTSQLAKLESFIYVPECIIYVAAKSTYIRLLHGKIGFLGFFSALAP